MNYLKYFLKNVLLKETLNKFNYKNINELIEIKKIILSINIDNVEIKQFTSIILALHILTGQKAKPIAAKKPNILFKIRKGNPIGCKVTLRKEKIFIFISELINNVFPKIKNFNGIKIIKKDTQVLSFAINDIFSFYVLENNYSLFNKYLKRINITIVTNSKNKNKLLFVLNSLKFCFNNNK